jgi:uncharacterized protein (TIGR03067 family)
MLYLRQQPERIVPRARRGMTTYRTVFVLVGTAALGIARADPDPRTGLEELQGSWVPTTVEQDGKKMGKAELGKVSLTVRGKRYIFKIGSVTEEGSVSIDPRATPRVIDLKVTKGKLKGRMNQGIYKLTAGELTLCFTSAASAKFPARPKKFVAGAGSGQVIYVLTRRKP